MIRTQLNVGVGQTHVSVLMLVFRDAHLAAACTVASLAACAASTGRPIFAGPAPAGRTNAYVCGTWLYTPVPRGRLLLDLDAHPTEVTADSLARAVRAAGGVVVHVYHVPRVRARMDVRAATALTGWVRVVADSARRDVAVVASVHGALSAVDSARLVAGGAVLRGNPVARGTYWYGVTLPDSLLPLLRSLPAVYAVQPNLVCITSA